MTSNNWEEAFDNTFVERPFEPDGDWEWKTKATPWEIKSFIRTLCAEIYAEEYRNGSARVKAILESKAKEIRELKEPENWLPYEKICLQETIRRNNVEIRNVAIEAAALYLESKA